jgi:hypothetical protein
VAVLPEADEVEIQVNEGDLPQPFIGDAHPNTPDDTTRSPLRRQGGIRTLVNTMPGGEESLGRAPACAGATANFMAQ